MEKVRTADTYDTLFSEKYNETYHSRHGVYQEAEHVFYKGTCVDKRFKKGLQTAVLEIGFGTGFNFFMTAALAAQMGIELQFDSVEKDLLPAATLAELNHGTIPFVKPLRETFLDWRKAHAQKTVKQPQEILFSQQIRLNLFLEDARDCRFRSGFYDAVYLDAFSPDKNRELWTVDFLAQLKTSMKPGAWLSTYSAKGVVKRAMQEAGFRVLKKKGPAGKREMLTAQKKE